MSVDLRILLVEDQEDDALLIARALRQGGYVPMLRRVETPAEFGSALVEDTWDVVLADWTLPHFGALPALALLRERHLDLPFIVVTGTASDETAVAAMKGGAHDIVRKDRLVRLAPAVAREVRDAAERAERRAVDERYRTMVRNFPNGGVLLFDHDLRYTLAGGSGLHDIGLFDKMVEGHTLWEVFPAETAFTCEPHYRAGLAGMTTTYDLPYVGRTFEVHVLPVADAAGHITGGMVMFQDVTAAREAIAAQRAADEEARMRALVVEQVNDGVIRTDLQFRIESWNPAAEQIYGWRAHEVVGRVLQTVLPSLGFMNGQTVDDVRAVLQRDGHWRGEVVHPHRDGHELVIDSAVRVVHGMDSTPIGLVGVNRDNTERHKSEMALRNSEAYFRALTEHAADQVAVVTQDGMIRYASPSREHLLGLSTEERAGSNAFQNIHPQDLPHAQVLFEDLKEMPGVSKTTELRVQHRDSSWRVLEVTATNLLHDPAVMGIVINCRDITDRKLAEEQLAHDALHDPLTGLANRTLFFDRLNHALERARRAPSVQVGLLFLDLDRFKSINDSLGHMWGDRLLQEVSRRLEACVRGGDSVARLGGDEFAILSEDLVSHEEATVIAERVQQALAEPVELAEYTLRVSVSIGIMVGTAEDTAEELLRDADIAMYRAKRAGRSRIEIFDSTMLDDALMRLRLEDELRQAIETGELVLHYQPIVLAATGMMQGAEALVRWQHPVRGLIPPGTFIPIAEETGLIVPLGTWVLRAACAQAAAWQRDGLPPISMSVNVAAQQLRDPAFVTEIQQVLQDTGLDRSCLVLEVTETGAMADVALTIQVLTELRALGLRGIAVDDFGTGYSSLSMLQQLPITHVKIDRSFVRDLETNASNVTLARTIIAMGHALGLSVIAEGVETVGQWTILKEQDCDKAQGYLFGRPLPVAALEQLLRDEALYLGNGDAEGEGTTQADSLDEILPNLRVAYLDALRRGDRVDADIVVHQGLKLGLSSGDVALRLMQPVAYQIGELWQNNKLSIAQEHLATAIMERQLGVIHAQIPRRSANYRTLVLACVEGELHRMGSRMIADAFEEEGWRVVYLGADVPLMEFVAVVQQEHPDLVGLSIHSAERLDQLELTISSLRQAGLGDIPVLVGGYPFVGQPELAAKVGASGTVRDISDVVHEAERLLR